MAIKNKRMKEGVPLIYKDVPAETLASLFCNGIAYEPTGTVAHQVLTGLVNGMDKEKISILSSSLSDWQCRKIMDVTKALGEKLQAKRSLDAKLDELVERAYEAEAASGMKKIPIHMIGITEKCNRGCMHCGVLADMSLPTMPYKDLERYLGMVSIRSEVAFSYGEPLVYKDAGKDFGDAVGLVLEMFPHVRIGIITSGIRSAPEMRACEKLAKLSDFDRGRLLVTFSVRAFMDDMENARRTLKFFVENNIRIIPRIYGIPLILKDGKWGKNMAGRGKVLADLLAGFGIRQEDAVKMPSDAICRRGLWYMGRMATSRKKIGDAAEDYFGRDDGHSQIVAIEWDSRNDTCNNEEFGLMPDGSIVPGCCHLVSNFLRIGSLKDANEGNVNEMARQMREDMRGMLIAAKRGNRKKSCIPCVRWFGKRGREGGCAGIRDPERFRRAIPTPREMRKINRIKIKIPARLVLD